MISDISTYRPRFRDKVLFAIVMLISFTGILTWQETTVCQSDDWVYRCIAPPEPGEGFWSAEGEPIQTWHDAMESCINHFRYINGRLANLLFIQFQLTPRWVQSLVAGIGMFLMLTGLFAAGAGRRNMFRPDILTAGVFLFWFLPPWYDNMQAADYQFNYTVTSALWLGFICLIYRCKSLTATGFALTSLYTFLTGCMHESYTAAMIAFSITYLFFAPEDSRKRIFILICILCASFLLQISSGITLRFESETQSVNELIPLKHWIGQLISLWLLLAVAGYTVWRHNGRNVRISIIKHLLPFLAGCIVMIIICKSVGKLHRAVFPLDMLSITAILYCLSLWRETGERQSRIIFICAVALTGIYVSWLCQLVRWQRLTSSEVGQLISQMAPREEKQFDVYFCDITEPSEHPFFLMNMTGSDHKVVAASNYMLSSFFSLGKNHYSAILPDSLRGKKFEEWPEIPGHNNLRGAWPVVIGKGNVYSEFLVHFGPQKSTAKPLDRIRAMLEQCTFHPDNASELLHPLCQNIRIPSEDTAAVYKIYFISIKKSPNLRREFISLDTIPDIP